MVKFSHDERAQFLRRSEAAVEGVLRLTGWRAEAPLTFWALPHSVLYVPAADLLIGPAHIMDGVSTGIVARAMIDLRCDGLSLGVAVQDGRAHAVKAVLGHWSRREVEWIADLALCADVNGRLSLVSEPHVRAEHRSAWALGPNGLRPVACLAMDERRLQAAARHACALILGLEAE